MLGIYIHIPFCLAKCNYCNFISLANSTAQLRANYVAALIREIELSVDSHVEARPYFVQKCDAAFALNDNSYLKSDINSVSTVFFGGGTPSVLSIQQLDSIMNTVCKCFNVSQLLEVSIEVNPSTGVDFAALKAIGFNRISIGVQSFDDAELQILTRLHSAAVAEATIHDAQKHFDNVGIDLIYGIPGQTVASFGLSLNKAISTGVSHISAYNMTFEAGTKLHKQVQSGQYQPVAEDADCAMYEMLCATLLKANIHQYEVSNFAKRGAECLHNKNYWLRGNYIGFGAAAHSLLNDTRFANTNNISKYIRQLSAGSLQYEGLETLTAAQIAEERLFLGLRSGGIKTDWLNEKQAAFMHDCVKMGYATKESDMFVLSSSGRFITDSIVLKLI